MPRTRARRLSSAIVLVFLLVPFAAFGQYSTGGMVVERDFLDTFPEVMLTAQSMSSGGTMPLQVDLSSNMPAAGDQGRQGSCTAWAVAYGVRTWHVATAKRWRPDAPERVFSPAFVFNQLSQGGNGIFIHKALQLLVDQGCATLASMPYDAADWARKPDPSVKEQAWNYRAKGWARANPKDRGLSKQLLVEGNPLIAAIYCTREFMDKAVMAGKKWVYAMDGDQDLADTHGRHAVVIVGYDDKKQAFKALNSWGKGWGQDGYFWIAYSAWPRVCYDLYVAYDRREAGGMDSKPNAPLNVSATRDLADRVVLGWDAAPGADGYEVHRFNANDRQWHRVATQPRLFYTDTNTEAWTAVRYAVKAFNKHGLSEFSLPAEGRRVEKQVARALDPPTRIEASKNLVGAVNVSWDAVAGAAAYQVYTWTGKAWAAAARVKEPRWTEKTDAAGATRYYCVAVVNAAGEGKKSRYADGMAVSSAMTVKPGIPKGFTVSQGTLTGAVKVAWDKVDNATKYCVYRWDYDAKKWVFQTTQAETSWTDAAAGTKKWAYVVAAGNPAGWGEYTTYQNGWAAKAFVFGKDIPKLEGLKVSQGEYTDRIQVDWPALGGKYTYCLYRWPVSEKKWTQLGIFAKAGYEDRNVKHGEKYYYAIRVVLGKGYGDETEHVIGYVKDKVGLSGMWKSMKTQDRAPDKPEGARAAFETGRGGVLVSWDAAPRAKGYWVFKWNADAKKWETLSRVDGTTLFDAAVKRGTTQFYVVQAFNAAGKSDFTEHISVKVPAAGGGSKLGDLLKNRKVDKTDDSGDDE